MKHRAILVALAILAFLVCAACSSSRGVPRADSEVVPPTEVADFDQLYGQNCAGCHGVEGSGGAAMSLANPVFLAIADDAVIRHTAANGVAGTPDAPFFRGAGGKTPHPTTDGRLRGNTTMRRAQGRPA